MTIAIGEALNALGITEWMMRGEPTNETEFISMFRKVIDGEESSDPTEWGFLVSDVFAKHAELQAALPMKLLRAERTRRLKDTDWYALSDVPMDAAMTAYRQALRDITKTYTSLEDVIWPTKPE